MIHFVDTHLQTPTFVGIKIEYDNIFYLYHERAPNDNRLINLNEWLLTITNDDNLMDRMMHCDAAIDVILGILDRT
jgi:hypothetical protein